MNRIQAFFNSQHGFSNDFTYDFALRRLCVAKEDSWRGIYPSTYSSDYNPEPPLFAAKFANCNNYRHVLALANEDGKIALQDVNKRNFDRDEKALNAPQCHYNAVFDLEWAPNQMRFVSASGDHTSRLWQVDGPDIRSIRPFIGHSRSVKTAAFRRHDWSVFATGGRDGAIIIWDTRAKLKTDLLPRADNCIYSGHVGGPGTPATRQKRNRTPKMLPSTTSSSITGLAFQDTHTLISCGAGDGVIKVWDLRRNYTAYKKEPLPKQSLPYAGSSTFKGFTNLIVDKSGCRLYANCMDNTIYCYNLHSYSPKPLAKYKGLLNSTFYIKSCLSPDGKYLLSGSSNEKAYIWNLKYPNEPLLALNGHNVEVTCVAWGETNDSPIVTCSDDARHKIWRIGPEYISDSDRREFYCGHTEDVRQFEKRNVDHPNCFQNLEATPRTLRRLVEQNERTPGATETISHKRSHGDMINAVDDPTMEHDYAYKKPRYFESRGRRLFGPSTSNVATNYDVSPPKIARRMSTHLTPVPEDITNSDVTSLGRRQSPPAAECNQENSLNVVPINMPSKISASICTSPLTERSVPENEHNVYNSPPASCNGNASSLGHNSQQQQSTSSVAFYSPTSNLPNYVLNGEAPHLSLMSPKRKAKDKVDWLTKIRKQKLMSSCRSNTTLTEKINEENTNSSANDNVHGSPSIVHDRGGNIGGFVSSPRLQTLRNDDSSPRHTPRRRVSHTGHGAHDPSSVSSLQHPKTPTSSRRNSETTILRFFSVQGQPKNET